MLVGVELDAGTELDATTRWTSPMCSESPSGRCEVRRSTTRGTRSGRNEARGEGEAREAREQADPSGRLGREHRLFSLPLFRKIFTFRLLELVYKLTVLSELVAAGLLTSKPLQRLASTSSTAPGVVLPQRPNGAAVRALPAVGAPVVVHWPGGAAMGSVRAGYPDGLHHALQAMAPDVVPAYLDAAHMAPCVAGGHELFAACRTHSMPLDALHASQSINMHVIYPPTNL
jgi:hypothetical protein